MIRFNNDYNHLCHEKVMQALIDAKSNAYGGYCKDESCEAAASLIKNRFNVPESDIHFIVGGTQTNFIAIAAALKPYQGVIASSAGHISVHETGAVENTGHKVLELPHKDGKITAEQIEAVAVDYEESPFPEHVVMPGMVYISFPTEYGTVYTATELKKIYSVCKAHDLYLFIDGARLGYGFAARVDDIPTPEVLAANCDMFYAGGTKCGAMIGEALVINNDDLKPCFRNYMKMNGGLLAKGFVMGIQYKALFEDDLYFEITKEAVDNAYAIKEAFAAKGIPQYIDSPTNQIFLNIEKSIADKLAENYIYEYEGMLDETHALIRFCTSWSTTQEEIDALINDINNL